jgi:thermitase
VLRRYIKIFAVALLVTLVTFTARPDEALSRSNAQGDPPPDAPAFAPDRILVKADEDASAGAIESINAENDAETEERLSHLDVSVIELPEDLSPAEAVELYEASPNVDYAEPDYKVYPAQSAPNDPYYYLLYGLNNTGQNGGAADADVDAPEAWSAMPSDAPRSVVAVIDTGVDVNHPDLKDNVWVNPDETANNKVDDDRNGYVDDVNGWDFANRNASVFDAATEDKHGTHVAGTIAAEGNNGIGVAGVSPQAQVMPLKFIGSSGYGYLSDAAAALDYAVAEGVKVSNNSYGCAGCYSETLLNAIEAADDSGHLFVTAAGNDASNADTAPHYPASYNAPNIVSVASTDDHDAISPTSNYGATSVDLGAPGRYIYSTLPGNTYGWYSGTSMATPLVAGTAAMLQSKSPGIDDAQMKARLMASVDETPALAGKTVSGGRLNAAGVLASDAAPPEPPATDEVPPEPPATDAVPTITDPRPTSRARDRTPTISASVRDDRTELTKDDMKLYIDGRQIGSFTYDGTEETLLYKSHRRLARTHHKAKVIVHDADGRSATRTWTFRIR